MSTTKSFATRSAFLAGPHGIDLNAPGGLDRLFAYHRAISGDMVMEDPPNPPAPQRPEGISDAEWAALGDPGKAAIVRERAARTAAERDLAAARAAKPAPPATKDPAKPADPPKGHDGQPDVAALIAQAVEAALKPIHDREAQRDADTAAGLIREAVVKAAEGRLHDASDALAHIDLTTLVDANGAADTAKIDAALTDLATRKPHLAKVLDNRRTPAPGSALGGGGSHTAPLDERVKATLARMQASTGARFAGPRDA